ncbi:MAG: hypothetical protein EAY75_08405 [Bacteroidetes bacterium]|nr:MAG: hypothetical protein EAY75_08405 [Bacteroidota bacterium]
MINRNALMVLFSCWCFAAQSQADPFTGSEKVKTRLYGFSNFDRVTILDLDGSTEVEVGKPFSVRTSIKDKYAPILEVKQVGSTLVIVFKYTKDNNKYINKPKIKVRITCPRLDSLYKRGNSDILVLNVDQKAFYMANEGNGSAKLMGVVEQLGLKNDGNGNLNAEGLLADEVQVQSLGNGDVLVNAKTTLLAEKQGNGNIVQLGKAKQIMRPSSAVRQ